MVFHPIYSQLKLAQNHRFPILKYQSLCDEALRLYSNKVEVTTVEDIVSVERLKTVHQSEYVESFVTGQIAEKQMKRIGFPWSEQFVKRTRTAIAGTLLAAQTAIEEGIAINLTGGYHHAHPDFGSGFCVFNDLVISAEQLLEQGQASRVLIFDCDVHQGDGTATCSQANNNIFTCSIHCEKNFPARKQNSDWDVGLEKAIEDEEYLAITEQTLNAIIASFKPDFIFYDAGVDIHEHDDLGLFNISTQGVLRRDQLVFSAAKQADIPIAAVIGGGYQRDISALTQVHIQLIHAAIQTYCNN